MVDIKYLRVDYQDRQTAKGLQMGFTAGNDQVGIYTIGYRVSKNNDLVAFQHRVFGPPITGTSFEMVRAVRNLCSRQLAFLEGLEETNRNEADCKSQVDTNSAYVQAVLFK
jgi:hypothetical protein